MNEERRHVLVRRAEFGPGALERLSYVLRLSPSGPVALLGSKSLEHDQRALLEQMAGRSFASHLTAPSELEAGDVRKLKSELDGVKATALVASGGGTVMDAAKAITYPRRLNLVLVPKTLSGSEHTANTSWWEHDQKKVSTVCMADAVIGDPSTLVENAEILGLGALHAIAHVLATLSHSESSGLSRMIARGALADLLQALEAMALDIGGRHVFLRGGWMAAVGFALTGPRIGVHHRLVHQFASRREHARFSTRLLCSSVLYTSYYAEVLRDADSHIASASRRLSEICEAWVSRVEDAKPRINPIGKPAMSSEASMLMAAML